MLYKSVITGLIFLFVCNRASAQDTLFNGRKNKIGFVTGNGIQYIGQLMGNNNHNIALKTTYNYQITFFQLQYYRAIVRKKTFGIDILAQPQYNTTKYKMYNDDSTAYLHGHELGLNIGFLFRENTPKGLFSYYMMISSGPHYVSGTPHRQSSGFVFSNNLCAGVNLRLYKNLYADVRVGIRHISNAGFKIPNAGVNDMTLNEGFLVTF